MEVSHHLPDHDQLLGVLPSEVRAAGLDDVQELGHHGGHSPKVPRTVRALQRLRDALHLYEGRVALGVDLLHGRDEDDVDAFLLEQRQVSLLVTWVALQVLARAELGGVDEDADHHMVVQPAGGSHQREVAFVQVAHSGHEADSVGHGAPEGAHLPHGGRDLHDS